MKQFVYEIQMPEEDTQVLHAILERHITIDELFNQVIDYMKNPSSSGYGVGENPWKAYLKKKRIIWIR